MKLLFHVVRGIAIVGLILAVPRIISAEEAWVCASGEMVHDDVYWECESCADYGPCGAGGSYDHAWMCCSPEHGVCYVDGDHHEAPYPDMRCAE